MTALDFIFSGDPWAIAVALLVATLIAEDWALAIGLAASAEGLIAPGLAMAALAVGIALGDVLLYGLGRLARRSSWIRQKLPAAGLTRAERLVQDQLAAALLLARLVPGLRLAIYSACGYLRTPFFRFSVLIVGLVTAWTAGLFLLGDAAAGLATRELGLPAASAALLPILLVLVLPPLARRTRFIRRPAP